MYMKFVTPINIYGETMSANFEGDLSRCVGVSVRAYDDVVRYALLCGRPPFETSTLKETYMRIVNNKYTIPPHVSMTARDLICCLLTLEPAGRPSLRYIDNAEFFIDGHMPTSLDPSTCHTQPKFPLPVFHPPR